MKRKTSITLSEEIVREIDELCSRSLAPLGLTKPRH